MTLVVASLLVMADTISQSPRKAQEVPMPAVAGEALVKNTTSTNGVSYSNHVVSRSRPRQLGSPLEHVNPLIP
eukprot:1394960-Amorphochlora_amoeboformis.AAC.1